ncbi:MAG: ABC transporter permease [Rhodospirillales bacterium]|jgi:peptide/nickel transport system permease protein|nr:ABC transporter permease [Rhodospirillales bacterium]
MDGLTLMILKRLAFGVVTLFVISLIISLGVELLPGDLAQAMLGQSATPETLAAFRKELGLDQPMYVRYLTWITGILQGDLGTSLASHRPVVDLLGGRLGNTIFLAAVSAAIAVPVAVILGMLAALYRESWFDKFISMTTLSTISFPEFFVGYILVLFLAVEFNVFPSIAKLNSRMDFFDQLYAISLPAITLTLVVIAHMMRMTRAAILNVMTSPYIEMATLKGMTRSRIIVKHAFPNALSPVINVIVLNLAYLVVGVVVVEVVFVYPGLGQLLVDSVSKRDLPVVQASVMIFASTYVLLNLTADVLAIISNPKLRHPK